MGTVRTAAGVVANARAVLDGTREARTDAAGRFQLRDVAAGRHSLAVLSLGMTPYTANVIVPANDSLDFEIVLVKTVILDSVIVEGSTVRQGFARAFEERKKVGLGKFMDSLEVRKFGEVHLALQFMPGVRANPKSSPGAFTDSTVLFTSLTGAMCAPNVWIDMVNWGKDQGAIRTMRTDDILGIEVYARGVPEEFQPYGLEKGCGALVIWTRRLWPQGKGKPR
jgi:hypothetical protein